MKFYFDLQYKSTSHPFIKIGAFFGLKLVSNNENYFKV